MAVSVNCGILYSITNGMMALFDPAFHNLFQFDNSKGDHHHEPEERRSAGRQYGTAAARADRLDRRAECGELLCQRTSLAEVAGGEVRQEAGFVF